MKTVALGELAAFTSGGTPSRSHPEFFGGATPWITGADIREDGSISPRSFITAIGLRASSTTVMPPGTVVLVTRTSVGKVGILRDPTAFSQDITGITPGKLLEPAYLRHFLRVKAVHLANQARGATIKGVTREVVAALDVPLPTIDEQRRIAAILDHADTIRTKRGQVLTHLDTLSQSIFYEMFGDPLSNPRKLPRAPIGVLTRVVTGSTPPRSQPGNFGEGIEWIKSDNLGGDVATTATESLSKLGMSNARVAPAGSVLVTCIAGTPNSIGKASLVDRDVSFNQQINAVLPSPNLDTQFLLTQLKTAPRLVQAKSSGGMKGLVSKSSFTSIEILNPPVADQNRFSEVASAVRARREKAVTAARAAEALFYSLQARAFSGQL